MRFNSIKLLITRELRFNWFNIVNPNGIRSTESQRKRDKMPQLRLHITKKYCIHSPLRWNRTLLINDLLFIFAKLPRCGLSTWILNSPVVSSAHQSSCLYSQFKCKYFIKNKRMHISILRTANKNGERTSLLQWIKERNCLCAVVFRIHANSTCRAHTKQYY